jgi:S-(hydroxymethyl)glutathione dehydrogenase/alcohol dehydrogenase
MKTRAAVLWEAPGEWVVQDVELDSPAPTEVIVEMSYAGLCHSDDHISMGDVSVGIYPLIGGHEGAGIVQEVGSEIHGIEVGDHVITSFIPACGKCRWCTTGSQNLCDNGMMMQAGTQPDGQFRVRAEGKIAGTSGGLGTFSEHQVVDQLSLIKIDESIPLDVACLVTCGVQTGFGSAINAAEVAPGDVVMVIGAGGVGMNSVQGAAMAGANNVVVVDTAPCKKDYAPIFGATEVFSDFDEATEFVRSITNGQGADSAILTAGVVTNELIGRAYAAIRKSGTVAVVGMSKETEEAIVPGFNAMSIGMYQKRIQGVLYGMGSPRADSPRLLSQYSAGKLKLNELITARYTLDEINKGYKDMRDGVNIRGIIEF